MEKSAGRIVGAYSAVVFDKSDSQHWSHGVLSDTEQGEKSAGCIVGAYSAVVFDKSDSQHWSYDVLSDIEQGGVFPTHPTHINERILENYYTLN